MEPFFDGGLFELLIAIGVGYSLNFIFKRKFLLILYSVVSIAIPILFIFTNNSKMYIWFISISIFNSLLLIFLLWRQRILEPDKVLFKLDVYVEKLFKKKEANNGLKQPLSTIDKK